VIALLAVVAFEAVTAKDADVAVFAAPAFVA
jgi:hypothetical protein